jgi:antirestriction protein ArdC
MAKKKSSNSSFSIPEGEPIAPASNPVSPPPPAAPARPSITEQDIAASSVRQSVFDLAYEHRRMVYTTIKSGTFPLLPDKDGNIDASRPANIVSGYGYKGPTVLILKAHQALHGFPTSEYAAESQLEEANKRSGLSGITITNPHPVTISISDNANPGPDGKPAVKFIRLYNLAETAHPDAVRELAKQKTIEREQSFNDWQNTKAAEAAAKGETFEIRPYYHPRQRESHIAFKIDERDPEKYLAQVFTAMSLGTNNIKVNPDSTEVLRDNFVRYLYHPMLSTTGAEINHPMKIYSLGNRASALCKDNLRTMFAKPERKSPEQTRTQARQTDDMAMGM